MGWQPRRAGDCPPYLRAFLRKRIALLFARLQQQEQIGYIPMNEGCMDLDLPTQGSAAALAGSRLGRARHSVRAAPGYKKTRVGNRGGQGTARPNCRCPKVNFNCYKAKAADCFQSAALNEESA